MLIRESVLYPALQTLASKIVESQRKKGLRASGRSAASLKPSFRKNPNGITGDIYGASYFRQQANGRGPNSSGKPSREMVEQLKDWTRDKGLPIAMAWPVAINIARRGIRVPNRFNPGGVLSEPLAPANVAGIVSPVIRTFYEAELKQRISF